MTTIAVRYAYEDGVEDKHGMIFWALNLIGIMALSFVVTGLTFYLSLHWAARDFERIPPKVDISRWMGFDTENPQFDASYTVDSYKLQPAASTTDLQPGMNDD